MEYDLLTLTGHELEDVGRSLSWGALGAFLRKASPQGAIASDLYPDHVPWMQTMQTNVILADIYDVLTQINSNIVGGLSHKKAKKAQKYPRPWDKKKNRKQFGSADDTLPIDKMRDWLFGRKDGD